MALLPDRVYALLTDEERERISTIADGWRHEPRVDCPSCGASLGVRLKVTAGAVIVDPDGRSVKAETKPADPPPPSVADDGFNPQELRIIQDAEESGMFDAFCNAVREEKIGQTPANLRRFLFTFLQTARVTSDVPNYMLRQMKETHGGFVSFYSGNGVIAVVSDGVVREFIPVRYVKRGARAKMPGGLAATLADPEAQFTEWVRGRFGYVPRDSKVFADALRQPTVGSFGRMVQ